MAFGVGRLTLVWLRDAATLEEGTRRSELTSVQNASKGSVSLRAGAGMVVTWLGVTLINLRNERRDA